MLRQVSLILDAPVPQSNSLPSHCLRHRPYLRIIVNKADNNRVIGFHVLGPNSGEITQGWACALRMGATYESFVQTVGIHPTTAEEFTQLTVTKSSGAEAEKGNC